MVSGVNPTMVLIKLPVAAPSIVLLLFIVGDEVVAQQTPRSVIVAPPSLVILPPLIAEVEVVSDTDTVDKMGNNAKALVFTVNKSP